MLSGLFDEDGAVAEAYQDGDHCDSGSYLTRPPLPRSLVRLCGLDNLGATCYLNALLQTLHFTPEFRERLFKLGGDELGDIMQPESRENQVRSIPIQLQRLFAQLLLLNQQSCSTDMLTDSFGWTSREELQQHDVQELNRILFSAIESSLVGTSGEKLISSLYHGTLVNQIGCQSCGHVSEREEGFLDIAVPVTETNALEVGLSHLFVELELMEGQNQYYCDHCKKKVNATKGCRLKKLPDILSFALLRFQFDFTKGERYKETSKCTFPQELNMNPYCEEESSDKNYFELFSVVVHKGSTHGGHYFAYIKDVDGLGQWTHPDEAEIQLPQNPQSGKVDFIDCDSPIDLMKMLIEQHGGGAVSINRLCKELQEQTGVSWNKRFKRLYGPVKQFFSRACDVFVLDDTGMVSLQKEKPIDQHNERADVNPQSESVDFNDCIVDRCKIDGGSDASGCEVDVDTRVLCDEEHSLSGHQTMLESCNVTGSESRDHTRSESRDHTRFESRDDTKPESPNLTSSSQTSESQNMSTWASHTQTLRSHDQTESEVADQTTLGSPDQMMSSQSRDYEEPRSRDQMLPEFSGQSALRTILSDTTSTSDASSGILDNLLPIVEDHFQAPEVNLESQSEASGHLADCTASGQKNVQNRNDGLRFTPPAGHCWFSFDDMWVRPITDQPLRMAYQGKESAYMLFYRRKSLIRPRQALHNPLYGVSEMLVEEMDHVNAGLQKDRDNYDKAINTVNLNLLFSDLYVYTNGALHPKPYQNVNCQSSLRLTIDRRKSIRELKEMILLMRGGLAMDLEDMCLSKAKQLPAGVHLYEQLEDTSKSLIEYGLVNDSRLFIWNGKTVGDCDVRNGADCEPVLLIVSYSPHGDTSQPVVDHRWGYPKDMTLGQLRLSVSKLTDIPQERLQLTQVKVATARSGVACTVVMERNQDYKSLHELHLNDGERMTAELQQSKWGQGSLAAAEVARQNRMLSFLVENRCCARQENELWPIFPIEVDKDETIEMLKAIIFSEVATFEASANPNTRIRGEDDTHGLGPPVHEHLTVASVGWTQGQKIVLEFGDSPQENQVVLSVSLNVKKMEKNYIELTVDRQLMIAELLALAVMNLGQTGDNWHLRKTNWCGEAAAVLDDEDATVDQERLKDGDHLLIEEGKQPPKGFIRLSISRCYSNSNNSVSTEGKKGNLSTVEWVTQGIKGLLSAVVQSPMTPEIVTHSQGEASSEEQTAAALPSVAHIGDVEILKEATLADLKAHIMTLPELSQCDLPSLNYLRLQELQGIPGRPTKIYRRMDLTLKNHKISSATSICCTVLDHKENLSQSSILLNVRLRLVEQRQYGPPIEVMFDATSIPTPQSLRQCLADKLEFPLERLVLAKHFPDKFDWLIIKAMPAQVAARPPSGKGKKKKTQTPAQKKVNLRNAPYYLKDGDTIGVQLIDNTTTDPDFSTLEDDEGKVRLKALEDDKRKQRKERRRTDAVTGESGRAEVGIKIFVPDYQKKPQNSNAGSRTDC
ncbi:ubiquitin carboxyl-terminal hydrolase 40-like [Corticium candelabrum]|uniref:ubiquitin carboxyl-terminal hydrolase 40-like n=1 Tax=Corticium candelabrum TaxID=121492 RepID=UPI002E25A191|nr:ubiquitin carboxyl-terminal hydrolase 40-like [Corticium candelabrum]